jgi:ankyrin repeat protein
VFFEHFRALLEEANDEAFVSRLADYVRWIRSMYMFVRVERPQGSTRFVLGYVKCERVFSFALRLEKMRLRLSRIPPVVLTKVEVEENKALRLACVGETDYERALAKHSDTRVGCLDNVLLTPLGAAIYGKDEESAMALLDGGDDPNEVDGNGQNALHMAAENGCRPPLFQRVVARIHDVNTVTTYDGWTALMFAAMYNQLDVVISLMNHPGIDLNVQNRTFNVTALHWAVYFNHPAIVSQLLSDDKMDASLKDNHNNTALKYAIDIGRTECVTILRQHGAPEE